MNILNMTFLNPDQIREAANILTDSLPRGWPTQQDALGEIRKRLIPENTLLAAIEGNSVLGWGGILSPSYDGRIFELHPLAVRRDMRRQGVGRSIVTMLENTARAQGGLAIQLGADDDAEVGETSLSNVDLYDNLPKHLAKFQPGTHQSGFYLNMGYTIIGVVPDANGAGKPDILFGKRL